jgi:hypothetical protein
MRKIQEAIPYLLAFIFVVGIFAIVDFVFLFAGNAHMIFILGIIAILVFLMALIAMVLVNYFM